MIALGAQRDHSLDQAEKERQMKVREQSLNLIGLHKKTVMAFVMKTLFRRK